MTQRLSRPGAAFVRALEGVVLHFYWDASTPPVGTIGEGFTMRSAAFRAWWARNKPGIVFGPGATMTRAECDDVLPLVMAEEYGAAVNRFLGKPVPQHVFDGMASATYNMGPGSLDWKWAAAIKRGDLVAAGAYLRKTGITAGGKPLNGLKKRRKEESELIQTGDYAIGGNIGVVEPMADGVLVRGERGKPVRDLQCDLTELGYYDQRLDGIFGHGTEAAVVEFQRHRGLKVDGYAGPVTLKTIAADMKAAESATQPRKPAPRPDTPKPEPVKPPVRAVGIAALVALLLGTAWTWGEHIIHWLERMF